jgi:hypothetical protein
VGEDQNEDFVETEMDDAVSGPLMGIEFAALACPGDFDRRALPLYLQNADNSMQNTMSWGMRLYVPKAPTKVARGWIYSTLSFSFPEETTKMDWFSIGLKVGREIGRAVMGHLENIHPHREIVRCGLAQQAYPRLRAADRKLLFRTTRIPRPLGRN